MVIVGVKHPLSSFSAILGQTHLLLLPKADDRFYWGENNGKEKRSGPRGQLYTSLPQMCGLKLEGNGPFWTGREVREDAKIHKCWLQPDCCSIQKQCIALPILVGCSWLLNMEAAAN